MSSISHKGKIAKSKLEALVVKAQAELGVATLAVRNANFALDGEDQEIFMAHMCMKKAESEIVFAIAYLRRKPR